MTSLFRKIKLQKAESALKREKQDNNIKAMLIQNSLALLQCFGAIDRVDRKGIQNVKSLVAAIPSADPANWK